MKIYLARHGGFCFGVQRAVAAVHEQLQSVRPAYTLGPVIHNPQVVERLAQAGARVVDSPQEAEGSLIIRSHGVPPSVYDACRQRGLEVVDATCPFVKRIHKIVSSYYINNIQVIIVGDRDHPEVVGINGWCGDRGIVLADDDDARAVPRLDSACIVAQTTFEPERFERIVSIVKERVGDLTVCDTICSATRLRQAEAEQIARLAQAVLVVGGRNSANTARLAQLCARHCARVYAIETDADLDAGMLEGIDALGVVAGASTPEETVGGIVEKVSLLLRERGEDANLAGVMPEGNLEEVLSNMCEIEKIHVDAEALEGAVAECCNQADACCAPCDQAAVASQEPVADEQVEAQEAAAQEQAEVQEPDQGENEQSEQDSAPDDSNAFMQDLEKMVKIRVGQIVKGTVVYVNANEACINIGYKADGILPRNEATNDPEAVLTDLLKPGEELDVKVIRINDGEGNVLLSKKALDSRRNWTRIIEAFEGGAVLECTVREIVKGGLVANLLGMRAFIPASQIAVRYVADLTEYVGKPLAVKIIDLDKGRKRIVASHKVVMQQEEDARKQEIWDTLEVGQVLTGKIVRLASFGAFVDIGGLDGMVHVTELSWNRINHPSEAVKTGQEIQVVILSMNKDGYRISLGHKRFLPRAWDLAPAKYPVGTILEGRVVRLAPFGAFIEIEQGLDGLVHISEVAQQRIARIEDVLQVGDVVRVKVLNVDPQQRRISLSIRGALAEAYDDFAPEAPQEKSGRYVEPKAGDLQATASLADFFPADFGAEDEEEVAEEAEGEQ